MMSNVKQFTANTVAGNPGYDTCNYLTGVIRKGLFVLTLALFATGCKKDESVPGKVATITAEAKLQENYASTPDFTIAVIPDTQYYVSSQFGGTPAMFTAQMDWIKTNKTTENIVYVACLGDITDHGNDVASEWTNATTNGYYKLETPLTGLPNGIPYGPCVGNHDQTPNTGHPLTCSTSSFNAKFGKAHFTGRAYYGGNYSGTSNDSHYDLFTAGGVDFIVIYTEYDSHGDDGDNMNTWAYNLLGTYASRKAIIVSHMMTDASGAWGTTGSTYAQGQVLYDRVKTRPNVFMFLGGHFTGESYRVDTYNGNTIRTYMSDYQNRANGGDGYMRLMKFSLDNNSVDIKTYSPHLGLYETDSDSQFSKPLFAPSPLVFDDFQQGTSHFYSGVAGNGTTVGINTSTSTALWYGGVDLQVTMNDDATVTTPWKVRLLSGAGAPVNNVLLSKNGIFKFDAVTSSAQPGATVRIFLDDTDGTEQSVALPVINDGLWHTYQWDLSTFSGSQAFPTLPTNGVLDAPQVTLDAIVFEQPNTSTQCRFYIDNVSK